MRSYAAFVGGAGAGASRGAFLFLALYPHLSFISFLRSPQHRAVSPPPRRGPSGLSFAVPTTHTEQGAWGIARRGRGCRAVGPWNLGVFSAP